MPRVRLTEKTLSKLLREVAEKPAGTTIEYTDEVVTVGEFGVRIYGGSRRNPSGKAMFFCRTRYKGRKIRVTLGSWGEYTLAEAREEARKRFRRARRNENPGTAEPDKTFAALAAAYMEHHSKPNKRSWKQDEYRLRKHLLPAWGHMQATDITREDIKVLLKQIRKTAPVGVNRVHSLVSAIFTYGLDSFVQASPAYRIRKLGPETERDRVYTEEEMLRMWSYWEALESITSKALRVMMLTGRRGIEVRQMERKEIHRKADGVWWWIIPGEKTKNKKTDRIFMTDLVMSIVQPLLASADPWVFPGPGRSGHLEKWSAVWRNTRRECQLENANPHDMRTTFITSLLSWGHPLRIVSAVVNHAKRGVTLRSYDWSRYTEERIAYLQQWSDHIERLITPEPLPRQDLPSNVVVGRFGA